VSSIARRRRAKGPWKKRCNDLFKEPEPSGGVRGRWREPKLPRQQNVFAGHGSPDPMIPGANPMHTASLLKDKARKVETFQCPFSQFICFASFCSPLLFATLFRHLFSPLFSPLLFAPFFSPATAAPAAVGFKSRHRGNYNCALNYFAMALTTSYNHIHAEYRRRGKSGGPEARPTCRPAANIKNTVTRHKYTVQYTNIIHSTQIYHTLIVKSEKKMFKKKAVRKSRSDFCSLEGLFFGLPRSGNPKNIPDVLHELSSQTSNMRTTYSKLLHRDAAIQINI